MLWTGTRKHSSFGAHAQARLGALTHMPPTKKNGEINGNSLWGGFRSQNVFNEYDSISGRHYCFRSLPESNLLRQQRWVGYMSFAGLRRRHRFESLKRRTEASTIAQSGRTAAYATGAEAFQTTPVSSSASHSVWSRSHRKDGHRGNMRFAVSS